MNYTFTYETSRGPISITVYANTAEVAKDIVAKVLDNKIALNEPVITNK